MARRLSDAIHLNLAVLEFDSFLKREAKTKNMEWLRGLSNSPDLLLTQDRAAFHAVTHFLFQCLAHVPGYEKWSKQLKACFPCLDKAMESDFRKVTAEFFSALQKETDFRFKKMPFATILMNPGKEQFLYLYVKFANFVLVKQSSQEARQEIRSLKSHQSVADAIRANLSVVAALQRETCSKKAHLLSIADAYKQQLLELGKERNVCQKAAGSVAAEWKSVFPEKEADSECCSGEFLRAVQLRSRLPHEVPQLMRQLEAELVHSSTRAPLLQSTSRLQIVKHMTRWAGVGMDATEDLREVSHSVIQTLYRKNATADFLAQKTDADVATAMQEMLSKLSAKTETSRSLRQAVLGSGRMKFAKEKIADQLGLHSWLDLNFTPLPAPADGTRKWREREKQRQQSRRLESAVVSKPADVVESKPQAATSQNLNDSPDHFSMMNATVEMSRMPADYSMLDSSNNNPDFLLDTSEHAVVS